MNDKTTRNQRLGINEELNFIQAFLLTLLVIAVLSFMLIGVSNRIDKWGLETCEQWGDCEEVYKELGIK